MTTHRDHELTETQAREIIRLVASVWPPSPEPEDDRVASFLSRAGNLAREKNGEKALRYVVWDGDRAVANGKTFSRIINTGKGPLEVLALSCVCVVPERRGEGLGKAIVAEAFRRVDRGEFSVSLFQTGVRDFYEKLDGRVVENRFCNRLDKNDPEGSPWKEPYAMIYPDTYDWPDGTIDINGPRY